jgi:APA family basic amino acid/polyamine antiporter
MATSTAPSDAGSARREGELDTKLSRTIGTGLLFLFILGDMVGGGIYALVGEVGGAIWTAFAVSAVLAFMTALSYAELTTKYPLAAGAALYAHKAFRTHIVTFMVAFAVMMSASRRRGRWPEPLPATTSPSSWPGPRSRWPWDSWRW